MSTRHTILISILAVVSGVLPVTPGGTCRGGEAEAVAPAVLFEATCSRCHPSAKAEERTRSPEEWQTLVARMRDHAKDGEKAFSQETAATIVTYLSSLAPVPLAPAPALVSSSLLFMREEEHEGALEEVGKMLGVATAVLVVVMIASGLLRRKLKTRFRPLHITVAIAIAVAVLAHGVLLFYEVGFPRTVWHLSGSLGLVVLLATAAGGLLRQRLGKQFLALHMTGALVSLGLIILHRLLD